MSDHDKTHTRDAAVFEIINRWRFMPDRAFHYEYLEEIAALYAGEEIPEDPPAASFTEKDIIWTWHGPRIPSGARVVSVTPADEQ